MRYSQSLVQAVAFYGSLATAIDPPQMPGMSIVWSDAFKGTAGASPDPQDWSILDAIHVNNEVQTYSTSNENIQISGGESIQFVPRKHSNGDWTSGRIETKGAWTPAPGKVMKIAASLLIGTTPREMKQGMWPAFWALGDAMRHGTEWPLAGEIDIFEQVSGHDQGWGTVHCGHMGGGPCNEQTGLQTAVALPADGTFNEWAVTIDLTNGDWRAQTLCWTLNGAPFKTLTGAQIGDQGTWATLAHSPLYMTLNVAVGGNWPGDPNAATLDGYGSMMEVHWVAVYSS